MNILGLISQLIGIKTLRLTVPTCDKELIEDTSWWRSYVDGASNAKRAGTRAVIITPDGAFIEQSIRLDFKASNNEAEYETVLAGLN